MKTISYQQLREIQDADSAKIVNVLPEKYFKDTNIPGSINIPFENDEFVNQVEKLVGKKSPLVVYCASYFCDASKKAALKLLEAGFMNVMCYEGGAKEWQEKNNVLAS